MIIVESMREALDVLEDVEKIVASMMDLAEHGAFLERDLYDCTKALREAMGMEYPDVI